MKIEDTQITDAGVFRCCIGGLGHGNTDELKYGDTLNCPYCGEEFTLTKYHGKGLWLPTWQIKEEKEDGN